ncbi:hypothetical protein ACFV2U_34730 [Streptomyces sp. NPDC059697]|uniref:hypothetical protein n=1 Tax=Streptomyces sp. NPDC059697 TaxID=3346912 RepID=UPI0036B54D50
MFVTEAILSGLPPHIAQVICGHKSISTTMGYKATYPTEAIEAHRPFIARRRAQRPSEEYAPPPARSGTPSLATSNAASSRSVSAPVRSARPASTNIPA